MTAWVILIGFAVAVVGVVAKVLNDVRLDLKADREAHGGRQTLAAAKRAWWIIGIVLLLVLAFIVLPLLLSDTDDPSDLGQASGTGGVASSGGPGGTATGRPA